MVPFVEEALITVDPKTVGWQEPRVLDWQAIPWADGGFAAVVSKNPGDEPARVKVAQLLRRLSGEPGNGIAQMPDRTAIAAHAGAPTATFCVDMQSNYSLDKSLCGPVVGGSQPLFQVWILNGW